MIPADAILVLSLLLYLCPALVASWRRHHQSAAIWVLTLLLGWTVLGWVGSLAWAVSPVEG